MLKTIEQFMRPPPGLAVDFSAPAGAPALAPADGVSWKVFANPVSLFIGGVTAVLLELAEPSVRSGVWDHSSFQRDPAGRLHRTGFAAMVTVYGPREAAQKMIARVVQAHGRVQGVTPGGVPYQANDPRLLDWVQATAIFGFTQAYHCYVSALEPAQRSAAFAEGQASAQLYGAVNTPRDWAGWEALLSATAPGLEGSAILTDFLNIMENTAILPRPLRFLQRLLVRAAVEITPEPVRSLPQLRGRGLRGGERFFVRAMARMATWWPLPGLPPAQAARRMAASR